MRLSTCVLWVRVGYRKKKLHSLGCRLQSLQVLGVNKRTAGHRFHLRDCPKGKAWVYPFILFLCMFLLWVFPWEHRQWERACIDQADQTWWGWAAKKGWRWGHQPRPFQLCDLEENRSEVRWDQISDEIRKGMLWIVKKETIKIFSIERFLKIQPEWG